MIEGPYKCRVVGLCSGQVVDERTDAVVSELNHKDDAYAIAHMMNKAHAHATEAAAKRVRELEEALEHIVEYWNRGENDGAMSDALYHMIDTAEAALSKGAE